MGDGSLGAWTGNLSATLQAFQACRASLYEAAGSVGRPASTIAPYLRHALGANYAFADGHAKWYKPRNTLLPNILWFKKRSPLTDVPANCNDLSALDQ